MEFSTILALFFGTFAIVHCLDHVAKRVRDRKRENQSNNKRRDWYCFFSPSILLGKDNADNAEEPAVRSSQEKVARDRLRRQQEQRRPILKL